MNRELKRWELGLYGSIAGLVAAGAGLAVAEMAAVASDQLQSPVLDVGDRVVDGVPNSIKTLAIEWFGTKDKLALLIGIGAVLAVYAAALGIVSLTRRWPLAIAGAAVFGAVGAYASQSTRRPAPWWAVAPSLLGGLVAALALVAFRHALLRPCRCMRTQPGEQPDGSCDGVDRRRFLVATGATAAGAAVVGRQRPALATSSNVADSATRLVLPRPAGRACHRSTVAAAAGVAGASPFVTPERRLLPDRHRPHGAPRLGRLVAALDITGMVDREMTLSYADLLSRRSWKPTSRSTCVSNEVGGKLIGNARWLGVRLDDLLDEAGDRPGRRSDRRPLRRRLHVRVPRRRARRPGRPDRDRHERRAAAARARLPGTLIVPGLYGYVSRPSGCPSSSSRRSTSSTSTGCAGDGSTMRRSRSRAGSTRRRGSPRCAPAPSPSAVSPGPRRAASTASSSRSTTASGSRPGSPPSRTPTPGGSGRSPGTPRPGRHTIRVRATERGGAIQTDERSEPFPSGATGQHQIVVLVE